VEAFASAAWTLVILALIFGLAVAQSLGSWSNLITLTAGGMGLLGLGSMIAWSRWNSTLNLFQQAEEGTPNLLALLLIVAATLNFALTGYTLQLYGFFFHVKQYSAFVSGLALAPIVLFNLFWFRWAARFSVERPTRTVVTVGLSAMAVAAAISGLMDSSTAYLWFVPAMALFGLGFLLASTAWTYFFFSVLPGDLAGVNAGINRAAMLVGGAISGAVLNAVLQFAGMAEFTRRLAELGLSEAQKAEALLALDAALQQGALSGEGLETPEILTRLLLLSVYREAFNIGVTATLLTVAGVCVAIGGLAWLWMRRSFRQSGEQPEA
jgi:MFS family permease